MQKLKIGVIKEGKNPPDFRVPLTPRHCRFLLDNYSNLEIYVQSSPVRRFDDLEYADLNIPVVDDLSHCDVMVGVKEVPLDMLIPSKKYFFFSHTLKKQPYNAKLLRACLEKKIELIDYECLKDKNGKRLIGFGKYAGIVGVYEGIRTYGKKFNLFDLLPPLNCHDRNEMELEFAKMKFNKNMKAVVTGFGRVGHGAEEMLQSMGFRRVSKFEFSQPQTDHVYLHLDTPEYYQHQELGTFEKADFYANPSVYSSTLAPWVHQADIYFACHLWKSSNPVLLTQADLASPKNHCRVIADISCDINGPIASTLRSSSIADPEYGYNPSTGEETEFTHPDSIAVMAIDNLPCALPRDASEDFGNEWIKNVLPHLLQDSEHIIENATETKNGALTPPFEYLADYAAQP